MRSKTKFKVLLKCCSEGVCTKDAIVDAEKVSLTAEGALTFTDSLQHQENQRWHRNKIVKQYAHGYWLSVEEIEPSLEEIIANGEPRRN